MNIKAIVDEDVTNYKKPAMTIGFPNCTFKCNKECGRSVCQNMALTATPNITISANSIITRYNSNPLTEALICAGLEPFDNWQDLLQLVDKFRNNNDDDIVIYTGYTEEEIQSQINNLSQYKNIIIKFGRYVPDQQWHKDELLGVNLASDNQYAKKIS